MLETKSNNIDQDALDNAYKDLMKLIRCNTNESKYPQIDASDYMEMMMIILENYGVRQVNLEYLEYCVHVIGETSDNFPKAIFKHAWHQTSDYGGKNMSDMQVYFNIRLEKLCRHCEQSGKILFLGLSDYIAHIDWQGYKDDRYSGVVSKFKLKNNKKYLKDIKNAVAEIIVEIQKHKDTVID